MPQSRHRGCATRLPAGVVVGLAGLMVVLLLGAPAARGQSGVPAVKADAALLVDLESGRVLYAKNADAEHAPASLVKLMTLYLAYADLQAGRVQLADPVPVSRRTSRTPRFRIGLLPGQKVPLGTLLAAVAVISANDAAAAVAEYLAGDEDTFVTRMNVEARRLGLGSTVFANPHGLPDTQQRTTARDMAALLERLLAEYPESRDVLGDTGFAWRGRQYERHISLFRDPGGVAALKTGFTLESRYNLAVAAGPAGQRLVCIILGADTRGRSFAEAGQLLKFGLSQENGTPHHVRPPVTPTAIKRGRSR